MGFGDAPDKPDLKSVPEEETLTFPGTPAVTPLQDYSAPTWHAVVKDGHMLGWRHESGLFARDTRHEERLQESKERQEMLAFGRQLMREGVSGRDVLQFVQGARSV